MKVISNYSRPLTLTDGTILAASGTEGSVREIKSLGKLERNYVDRGWMSVIEEAASPNKRVNKEAN